jgi:hypothetical protein
MRYMDSLRFMFVKPTWLTNALMCVLCMLIPIVGPIVLLGYMYVVFDSIHRDPKQQDYPDFKFDRFTEYLIRGIWPFLVQMIAQAVIMAPMFAMYFVAMIVSVAAQDAKFLVVLAWLAYAAVAIGLSVLIAIIMWPAQLHAGYGRQFDFGGMIAFIKDFMKKVRKELILSILFLMAVGFVLGPIGVMACCVGVWFVAVGLMFAQYHLKHQLYAIYLERGGKPIPVKGEQTESTVRPAWPESPTNAIQAERPPDAPGGQSTGIQSDLPKS